MPTLDESFEARGLAYLPICTIIRLGSVVMFFEVSGTGAFYFRLDPPWVKVKGDFGS
jgi:hypothetical protein